MATLRLSELPVQFGWDRCPSLLQGTRACVESLLGQTDSYQKNPKKSKKKQKNPQSTGNSPRNFGAKLNKDDAGSGGIGGLPLCPDAPQTRPARPQEVPSCIFTRSGRGQTRGSFIIHEVSRAFAAHVSFLARNAAGQEGAMAVSGRGRAGGGSGCHSPQPRSPILPTRLLACRVWGSGFGRWRGGGRWGHPEVLGAGGGRGVFRRPGGGFPQILVYPL